MSSLQKLRVHHVCKWVSFICTENNLNSSNSNLYVTGSYHILQHFRFCSTERSVNLKNGLNLGELAMRSRAVRKEAQAALLEYLHNTRSLQFTDAENMSKNTPVYFDKLLKRVDIDDTDADADIAKALTRFLRYHPINEFEPFFESIGLSLSEYSSFLPRNLMFLLDDELLLENYYVLSNYGIARNRIGKIYKEAMEVFRYDYGVMRSKLQSFENFGLKQSLLVKLITSCPYLLRGNVNSNLLEALGKLKKAGIEYEWLTEHISEDKSYNWKRILELISLFSDIGVKEEQLGELLKEHPDMLLEQSGGISIYLFGFLLKFGLTQTDIQTLFHEFPNMSVLKFKNNLCQCYKFLIDIRMDIEDIGMIVHSYALVLGSCELKKLQSLLCILNCGMKRLCEMILEDPNVLKTWVKGLRVDRQLDPNKIISRLSKTNFLLNLGFAENSKEMEKALKVFRGKGDKLQERFDCLVSTGLSREEVIKMLKVSPQILNQNKDVIKTKIDFFVNLGYPVSDLVTHPSIVSYKIERVKNRLLAYKWLRHERVVHPRLSLSTLLSCSEDLFVKTYVRCHPRGLEYWEKLKKEVYSNTN